MDSIKMNSPTFKPIITDEFGIFSDLSELPVSDCPSYLVEAIGAVSQSGTATLQVYNTKCRIKSGMIIVLLPWQLVSIKEISDDFRLTFFRISKDMFIDSLSTLWRLTPEFFFYMRKHFVSEPDEGNIERFIHYCGLLDYRTKYAPENCRRESIMQLLRVFYWDVYAYYLNDPLAEKTLKYTRKEELAFRFIRLMIEEHSPNTDVNHYSRKLGVSSKYLTTLIKDICGRSARDLIVEYTILEIKSLLRDSMMDLKTIASRVNFPDQSSFSRYFRHYTGMSPTQYRKNIHF